MQTSREQPHVLGCEMACTVRRHATCCAVIWAACIGSSNPGKARVCHKNQKLACCQVVVSVATMLPAVQVLVTEFEGWASVEGDKELAFDWDDLAGDLKRRQAGLRLEALRLAEMKRRKAATRGGSSGGGTDKELGSKAMAEAMRASRQKKE